MPHVLFWVSVCNRSLSRNLKGLLAAPFRTKTPDGGSASAPCALKRGIASRAAHREAFLVKPIIGLGFVAAVAIAAAPQDKGPKKRAEGLGERVNEILSVSVDDDATRRRVAVEKLLDVGPEAVPYVGEALGRGNKNIVRTCIVALGEIGNESCQAELVKYFATRKPGDAVEVAVIAAYALGGCPGHAATETLLRLVDDPAEAEHVRAAAAVALARAPIADKERLTAAFAQASKRGDADPEVLGGLALAVGAPRGPSRLPRFRRC